MENGIKLIPKLMCTKRNLLIYFNTSNSLDYKQIGKQKEVEKTANIIVYKQNVPFLIVCRVIYSNSGFINDVKTTNT